MSDCEIKPRWNDGSALEVHVQNAMEVAKFVGKFDVSKEMATKEEIQLTFIGDVHELIQYQWVTKEGKVVELDKVKEALGSKKKLAVVIY